MQASVEASPPKESNSSEMLCGVLTVDEGNEGQTKMKINYKASDISSASMLNNTEEHETDTEESSPRMNAPKSTSIGKSVKKHTKRTDDDETSDMVSMHPEEFKIAFMKSSKRSSSSSNDLLYERDRFRARFHTLNTSHKNPSECSLPADAKSCEVCDKMGLKTTKLNISRTPETANMSPLDVHSPFFQDLEKVISINEKFCIRHFDHLRLKRVFEWYFNQPLPNTGEMFPWLHGLHKDNFAQKQFFVYQFRNSLNSETMTKPKNVKFLICVNSSQDERELKNTIDIDEILYKIDVSKSECRSLVYEIVDKVLGDTDDGLKDSIFQDCVYLNYLPIFLDLDPDRGVSLRNFHIQVAKSATCADFIVYGKDKLRVARILCLAQHYEASKENVEPIYNTFILDAIDYSDKSVFTTKSELVTSDSKKTYLSPKIFNTSAKLMWDNDYQSKEKLETARMSSATQLDGNLWVGNIWDHQVMSISSESSERSFNIENRINLYCDPDNSIVSPNFDISKDLDDYFSFPKANWQLLFYCSNAANFASLSTLSSVLSRLQDNDALEEDLHALIEFPPSGSIGIGDCNVDNLMSLLNSCKLIYEYSSRYPESNKNPSVLIYCSDGYTESSLLVLCYLIYSKNIPLSEAVLQLHVQYGRPFYIFNSDVMILKKLEKLLRSFSPLVLGSSRERYSLETLTNREVNEVLLSSHANAFAKSHVGEVSNFYHFSKTLDPSGGYGSSSSESDSDSDIEIEDDWVVDVEGSLPSRILPYIYLGSLKHANNPKLLSKIGIRSIISVGESLDWLHDASFYVNYDIKVSSRNNGNIEIFDIEPRSQAAAAKYSVRTVVKVNNLQDDGIDELSTSLPEILRYIETEYNDSRGETKILVHCRVGVSRSATVVIAEVMRNLDISLAKAYLYVRVRRLNIIIQPNLRFMYELFKWEEEQKMKKFQVSSSYSGYLRDIDWCIMCREIMRLNIPYLSE